MALKIRLWQQGCKNRRCYRVVVADGRSPRDGRYVEAIGWYNPCARSDDQKWLLKEERLQHWLSVGAQLSPTVTTIAKKATPAVLREHAERKQASRTKKIAKRRARAA